MADPRVEAFMRKWQLCQDKRMNWDAHWDELRRLVRINVNSFGASTVNGDRRADDLFDGTAPWANEQLASFLASSLTSPTDRWMNIGIEGISDGRAGLRDEELAWLEDTTDAIYHEYSNPVVNLYPNLNENYLDLGGLGTTVLYQDWDWDEGHVYFKSFPLADCYVLESARGRVDTLFRRTKMTVRQILQEFNRSGDMIPDKITNEQNMGKEFTVIHGVYPRSDSDRKGRGYGPRGKAIASCWVVEELKEYPPLRESGFDQFPYHVPRWSKLSGEVYGRAPAMTALPDIKMINTMSKVVIKAAQKVIDPPLIVPDDGFMLPIKTSPGSLIFKTAGQEDTIQPLKTEGRIDIGNDMMEQRRGQILKTFYVDMIIRQKKSERQTQEEIQDDRQEMLRQMGPILGRTQVELINPLVQRTYYLLDAVGRINPAPESLRGRVLRVFYVSPAAKAQYGSKATNLAQFMNDLGQYGQAHPEIFDIVDTDALAEELAKYRDVSRKVIRSPQAVAQVRQQRQQQEQMAQAAATSKDAATAANQFAQARQTNLQEQQA